MSRSQLTRTGSFQPINDSEVFQKAKMKKEVFALMIL